MRADSRSYRAWLATITRNRIRDFFRRQHGLPAAVGGTDAQQHLANLPEPSDAGSSPQLDAAISRRILELVRAEFEERTWDAFWRTAVEGQSPSDVGVGIVDRIGKIGRLTICRQEFGQRDSLRTRIVRIQEP